MKKFMKPLLALSLLATLCISCNNYGKKVTVAGTKGEVFYKGEGVTENDAKKLGDFLVKEQFLKSDKAASIQVSKEGEAYLVRFVYDKDYYNKTKGLEEYFKTSAVAMSKQLFDGKKVNIALADSTFADFKSIPYDEAFAKALDAPKPTNDGNNAADLMAGYDHHTEDGINFYWKDPISDKDAETIGKAVGKTFGSATGGNVNIVMTKEGDRYYVKFPVTAGFREDPTYIAKIESAAKMIKDEAFANVPYSFVMTDEQLNTVKTFDY